MPPPDGTELASQVLAGAVLLAAAFLGWRQWQDYKNRPTELSRLDDNHFARQDLRRTLGTIVMLLLALGLVLGGRMVPVINGQPNLKFVQVWSSVALLMIVLLILGMLDWVSNRFYARRHRQQLTQEGLTLVEAELRLKSMIHQGRERQQPNGNELAG